MMVHCLSPPKNNVIRSRALDYLIRRLSSERRRNRIELAATVAVRRMKRRLRLLCLQFQICSHFDPVFQVCRFDIPSIRGRDELGRYTVSLKLISYLDRISKMKFCSREPIRQHHLKHRRQRLCQRVIWKTDVDGSRPHRNNASNYLVDFHTRLRPFLRRFRFRNAEKVLQAWEYDSKRPFPLCF